MIRTIIQLPEEMHNLLREKAYQEKTSISAICREALNQYFKEVSPMKKFVLNLKDSSGNIRTGYEETVEAQSKKQAVTDYLHYHKANTDETITTADIDCVEVDWKEQTCANCKYYGDEVKGCCGVGNDKPEPCEPTDTCSQFTEA